MAAGFNVTAETLQGDATRIATSAGNVDGHIAFLKNAVESVVNSGWQGVAATEAAALHQKLDKAARDINESAKFFSQSTDAAAKGYAAREDEVRSAFSGGSAS
jgi:WXG100 family type VII secretion target